MLQMRISALRSAIREHQFQHQAAHDAGSRGAYTCIRASTSQLRAVRRHEPVSGITALSVHLCKHGLSKVADTVHDRRHECMVLMHVWLAAEPEAMPKVNSPAARQAYQCTSTGTVLLCSVQN